MHLGTSSHPLMMKRISSLNPSSATDHEVQKKGKRKMSESHHPHTSGDSNSTSNATPEGEQMLQYLNSLNPLEYAQYEAYRGSTLRADLVAKFVASCLVQIEQEDFSHRANARDFLRFNESSSNAEDMRLNIRPHSRGSSLNLDDLVEPGAAPEITIAVSSMAKSYAQRLIQASRAVASAQGCKEQDPLLPSHVLQAHHQRSQTGLDPGFFLQPSFFHERGASASHPFVRSEPIVASSNDRVMAALAAQDLYDQMNKSLMEDENTQA